LRRTARNGCYFEHQPGLSFLGVDLESNLRLNNQSQHLRLPSHFSSKQDSRGTCIEYNLGRNSWEVFRFNRKGWSIDRLNGRVPHEERMFEVPCTPAALHHKMHQADGRRSTKKSRPGIQLNVSPGHMAGDADPFKVPGTSREPMQGERRNRWRRTSQYSSDTAYQALPFARPTTPDGRHPILHGWLRSLRCGGVEELRTLPPQDAPSAARPSYERAYLGTDGLKIGYFPFPIGACFRLVLVTSYQRIPDAP
jgi:hypothetical protein